MPSFFLCEYIAEVKSQNQQQLYVTEKKLWITQDNVRNIKAKDGESEILDNKNIYDPDDFYNSLLVEF